MDDMARDSLPDDIDALKALLHQAHRQLTQKENRLNEQTLQLNHQEQQLTQKDQKIQALHQLIHAYQEEKRLSAARLYAPSSEQEQRQYFLFNEAETTLLETDDAPKHDTVDATLVKVHPRRGGRKPLPDHLPRIEVIHDLSEAEKHCACGHEKHRIGENITEQLDIIPAKVRVLKHVRIKYACRHCDSPPQVAPMPPQPIPKSQVGAGFLAYVITSKYADALPLYRQCHILKRGGVDIARHTLCHQVVKAGELVQPLINLLQDKALSYPILQMDDDGRDAGGRAMQEQLPEPPCRS